MAGSRLALLLACTLLWILPVASADHGPTELQVEDAEVTEPIRPLGSPAELYLNATAPCPENGTAEAWVRLQAPNAPSSAKLDTWDETVDSESSCSETDHALDLALRVAVAFRQNAPAFQPVEIPLVATGFLNSTNESRELGPGHATVTATPGYFNLYNVRLDEKIQQAGPQDAARYEIVIDNYSNGDTRFEFETERPIPDGFDVSTPEPLLLNANATGGEQTSGTVTLVVYTPAHTPYTNEIANIRLNVTSAYAGDRSLEGSSSNVSTITQARGVHVPGPGATATLVGLAAVAWIARRSR